MTIAVADHIMEVEDQRDAAVRALARAEERHRVRHPDCIAAEFAARPPVDEGAQG